ncbi:hypothetical protein L0Y65_06860 [Candidatus Micrarchaeota archaeon]|nr:hypothetical protein [Candidatus Micrarchaeota archaeon]
MTVAQVSGKERIRGPNLAILVKRFNGVPMEEALAKADEAGVVIASNKRLSQELVGSDEWRGIREVFACWSGTMTGYEKPDQKLGKSIAYTDSETGVRYIFPVPQEHQGKKNVVLITEHPNFTLETDGKTRIVQAKEVGVVSEFPVASKKWYLCDAEMIFQLERKSMVITKLPDTFGESINEWALLPASAGAATSGGTSISTLRRPLASGSLSRRLK